MMAELIARYPWLWTLVWQSTVCLAAGLIGSYFLRRRAARAHQILLLGLIATALVPGVSQVIRQNQWGLFVAERAVPAPEQPLPVTTDDPAMPGPPTASRMTKAPATAEDLRTVSIPVIARFNWTQVLLPLWLAASAALLLRMAGQFLLGRRMVRQSEAIDEPRITRMIEAAKDKLAIGADVAVRTGRQVRSPVIWCWGRRPILLIPEGSCGSNNGLDWVSILCHELAHWKRRDHIDGLFAELLACALPWQPLVWWARQRLITLSEEACDDWVIASAQAATGYAKTLLGLVPQGQAALLPGVVPSRKGLAGRIHRILHDACGNPYLGSRWAAASIALAVCAILGVSLAQARPATHLSATWKAKQREDTQTTMREHSALGQDKVLLRLVDSDGKPVDGARAAAYVRVGDTPVLGSRLNWSAVRVCVTSAPGSRPEWPSVNTSDETGRIILDAKDVFQEQQDKARLYILHEDRRIGAVHEIIRAAPGNESSVVLGPVCRVRGTVASTSLATFGMRFQWAILSISSNGHAMIDCSFVENRQDLDLLLPPGAYMFKPRGWGIVEDLPLIGMTTRNEMLPVSVSEGQRDLDLGVIDLRPAELSTLLGRPAPEIGPMRAWRNGSPVTRAQLRGRMVWLHFGGEHPSESRDVRGLVELHEAFGDQGLTIVAIYNAGSLRELEQQWAETARRLDSIESVPFRIAIDGAGSTVLEGEAGPRAGTTYARYAITEYPTDVLIDLAGNVIGQANAGRARDTLSQLLGAPNMPPLAAWRSRFDSVYRLVDNEVLRWIAPPFIPERREYFRSELGQWTRIIRGDPATLTFSWDGQLRHWPMGLGRPGTLDSVLKDVLRLRSSEYHGPKSLLDVNLGGDWIVRDGASTEMKLRALEKLLSRHLKRRIRFEKRSVERDAIVATGRFRFHAPVGTKEYPSVHLCAADTDPNEMVPGGGTDSAAQFLEVLGDYFKMPVVDRTEPQAPFRVPYHVQRSFREATGQDNQERTKQLKPLLDHVAAQTEVQFEIRTEPVLVWHVTEQSDR